MFDNITLESKLSRLLVRITPVIFITILLATSCAEKKIDPYALQILPEDKVASKFPPTKEELVPVLEQMVLLVASKNETVSQTRLDQLVTFIRSGISNHSNVKNIPSEKLDETFKEKEFHAFQPDNVSEAIRLGKKLNARFVSQLQLSIKEAKMVEGVDRFKANVNFSVFTTDSGQIMFKQNLEYDSSNPTESNVKLKEVIQKYFPVKGYILETRGNHQVAKISVGRSLGVTLNQMFNVRARTVESTVTFGFVRRSVSYSQEVIAPVTVIKVMENEAWVSIPEKDRPKIKLGQVLFSLPEKN